jgi:hypothetical protein
MNRLTVPDNVKRKFALGAAVAFVGAFIVGTVGAFTGWVHLYQYGQTVGTIWLCGSVYFRFLDSKKDTQAARHAASYFAAIGVAVLSASWSFTAPDLLEYQLRSITVAMLGALAFRRWWRVTVIELGEVPHLAEALPFDVLPPKEVREADPAEVTVPIEAGTKENHNE